MSVWVKCSDRMPAQYRDVPIELADGTLRVGRLNSQNVWCFASYQKCKYQYSGAVHRWFDTPEPPK